jgi:hypothetical protein
MRRLILAAEVVAEHKDFLIFILVVHVLITLLAAVQGQGAALLNQMAQQGEVLAVV